MTVITTTEYTLPSGRPSLFLRLRNKRRAGSTTSVLFVHGATYPSTVTFDYAIEGSSWMDHLANRGLDTWCIDLLGYGISDRPPEMSRAALENNPLVDTVEAVSDVKRAVDFITALRGVEAIGLIGYSGGPAICGQVAGEAPAKVSRLVLAGALWVKAGDVQIAMDGPLGAYRLIDADATVRRWTVGLDTAQIDAIAPRERFLQWAQAAVASDPESSRHTPALLRAPTGVVKDLVHAWLNDTPTYDPALITCPALVVVGEWDQETTPEQGLNVFSKLTTADSRRFILIGAATHLMLLEDQRHQLYAVVQAFLTD